MAKVRLKNPVYATFSSYMGVTKFKDGVSEGDVSENEIRILGSITAIEVIDDDGNVFDGGPAQIIIDMRNAPAPVEKKLKPVGEADTREEITPGPVEVKAVEPENDEVKEAEEELEAEIEEMTAEIEEEAETVYSREELEAIADEKGIAGLREIGNTLGVKSNSIEDLIKKILDKQKG